MLDDDVVVNLFAMTGRGGKYAQRHLRNVAEIFTSSLLFRNALHSIPLFGLACFRFDFFLRGRKRDVGRYISVTNVASY